MTRNVSLPHRRAVLAGMAGALALPALAQEGPLPLWRAAAGCGILFGSAGGHETLQTPRYANLHAEQSRLFAFENALKFGWLNPRGEGLDFTHAEALLAFCDTRGLQAQGTALVWNDWMPDWYKRLSAREARRNMEAHLEKVAARFYGRFHSYGVVNEPFYPGHGHAGGYRAGPFYDAMGEDYIFSAFRRVAAIDPTTPLMLNETFCELNNALGAGVRAGMLTLIDKMLDKGIKLDIVGLETHLEPREPWDEEVYARFLEEIARRKLRIHLTEFDVNDEKLAREPAQRDAQVAEFAARFLKVALANKAVEVFVCWGLVDRYSWHRDPEIVRLRKREFPSRSLIFDDEYREKPITRTLRAAFNAAPMRG